VEEMIRKSRGMIRKEGEETHRWFRAVVGKTNALRGNMMMRTVG